MTSLPATRSILLVEDEPMVRAYFAQLLTKHGWRVTAAGSGRDALAVLSASAFDLILCDLDLGRGPNGIDVLRQRPPGQCSTPFVLLTAHGTVDRCRDAMRNGATNFLEKPIAPAMLLGWLEATIGAEPRAASDLAADEVLPVSAGDERVRLALKAISAQFANHDLSVEGIASTAGVSPEHLARLFRRHLGRTPLEAIHAARISAAEALLADRRLSIYEVARECGYQTTSDLDRWFHRFKAQTPSQWREQQRPAG